MIELEIAIYFMSFFAGLWVGLTIFQHELRKVRKKLPKLMTSEEYKKARKELLENFLNAKVQEEDN